MNGTQNTAPVINVAPAIEQSTSSLIKGTSRSSNTGLSVSPANEVVPVIKHYVTSLEINVTESPDIINSPTIKVTSPLRPSTKQFITKSLNATPVVQNNDAATVIEQCTILPKKSPSFVVKVSI